MLKPACRLYPVDIDLLPWQSVDDGVRQRVLTADAGTGALTRFVFVAGGCSVSLGGGGHWSEAWVWSGFLRDGATALGTGSYFSWAPDDDRPELHALEDALLLEFREAPSKTMDKASVRLLPDEVAALPARRPAGAVDGVFETVLAAGAGGSATRLLRVLPYVGTGVFVHDHSEEVILLDGAYRMGDEYHVTRTYTCKGPGVEHGPFTTSTGYLGLEVRNFVAS